MIVEKVFAHNTGLSREHANVDIVRKLFQAQAPFEQPLVLSHVISLMFILLLVCCK